MSIARHHAEWLSLVPVSGPFLSLPVLMESFNAGLEPHDPEHVRLLRQEHRKWEDSFQRRKIDPAAHQNWIKFVLLSTLELDERVLVEGQTISQTLQVELPEHHELLRPSIVVRSPDGKTTRMLVQVYPRSQDLTSYVVNSPWKASPDTRMTELLHGTGVRLGLVTNGEHWMLVDAPKGETTGYASWYATLWLEEPLTLRAFRSLLSANRFFNVPDDQTLESLLAKSASNQQEVTDQLGYQVRRAVEVLIHSLDRADQDFGRELLAEVTEGVLYESALTVMMRLVFLFCAEERELIPSKPFPVYEQNYSVSTISKQLRELADQHGEELLERRFDAWPRLLAAFRAVYGGLKHDEAHIPAYGGNLFNPDRFPFLEGRTPGTSWRDTEANPLPVNNRTVLHLLEALQMLQVKVPGGGTAEARRLSFRALDIEQIGHVYEGLLDHTAVRAKEPFLGLEGTRDKEPEIPLAELEKRGAKGEKELLKFLKDETGKSESALKKLLKVELDARDVAHFQTVCQGDEDLLKRVEPFAGLVRPDSFGYPIVIPKGSVFVTAGTDRRSSGTHYTPRSLTEPIVQYTLEPLVYVGPAEGKAKKDWKLKLAKELLDLKICDMACGSGAFLVQAARFMSERLLEVWDEAKMAHPDSPAITPEGLPATGRVSESLIPEDPDERKTYALRLVAQRCLYGVDKNPLAVEMAKLSLWLLTLAKDKPFEFLDHSIRCGDSLVGMDSVDQLRHFKLDFNPNDEILFEGPIANVVGEAITLRLQLEQLPTDAIEDVTRQERLLHEATERLTGIRYAADLLVGAELRADGASDRAERIRNAAASSATLLAQEKYSELGILAEKSRGDTPLFNWPLEFPEVISRGGFDAFVGNPPFMGGRIITSAMGEAYRRFLVAVIAKSRSGAADLSAYFFLRAFQMLRQGGMFGLLATNTICQGQTRDVGLAQIAQAGGVITRAVASRRWPGSANLEVSHVWCRRGHWNGEFVLDEQTVERIETSLSPSSTSLDLADPQELAANRGKSFQGSIILGMGFLLDPGHARELLESSGVYRDVLFPYLNWHDLTDGRDEHASRWVIHFDERSEAEARVYKEAWTIVEQKVKPERLSKDQEKYPRMVDEWWKFWNNRVELSRAIASLEWVLVTGRVSAYHFVSRQQSRQVFSERVVVFAFDDWATFALLSSNVHESWAHRPGMTTHETRPTYFNRQSFETFPFPKKLISAIGLLGEELESKRRAYREINGVGLGVVYRDLNSPDQRSPSLDELRDLYAELDRAVAASYGWDRKLEHGFHETKAGVRFTISPSDRSFVVQQLLILNQQQYGEEFQKGLHQKSASKKRRSVKSSADSKAEPTLFELGNGNTK